MAQPASDQPPPDPPSRPPSRPPGLPPGTRIAAVVSSYHGELVGRMADSARATLCAAGLAEEDFALIEAPGAFELPVVAAELVHAGRADAVLCFGLVLRGETDHDRYISNAVAQGLMRLNIEARVPVLFGLLTPNTLDQARARALPTAEGGQDKGREVALAAIGALAACAAARELFPAAPRRPGR